MKTRSLPAWAIGLIGVAVVIAIWWISAVTVFADAGVGDRGAIPTPYAVVANIVSDGFGFYSVHILATLRAAGIGFLWGNGLALLLTAVVLLVPATERVALQVAVLSYCIPIVAIGPLIYVIVGAPRGNDVSLTAVVLAAMSVFFTTVVGSLVGLKAADRSALDVVTVYGGSKLTQLRKVRLVASLPAILSALQIAVPSAFLGAVLGEYFGGVSRGVAPAMSIAAGQINIERTWSLALLAGLVAGLGYVAFGLVARAVAPWSRGQDA